MRTALILAMSTLYFRVGVAQSTWTKQIDYQHQYDYFIGLSHVASNGTILLAGGHDPFITDPKFLLVKMADNGDLIWEKSIALGPGTDGNASNFLGIDEKTSLIEGTVDIYPTNSTYDTQHCYIKIDNETGDTIWTRLHGLPDRLEASAKMIALPNGEFAMIGWVFKTDNSDHQQVLLVKIDSLGNQVLRRTYTTDPSKHHYGWSLAQSPDGGFMLLAFTKYNGLCNGCQFNNTLIENLLIKTDSEGNEQWVKYFPVWEYKQFSNPGSDIVLLPDSNYLITGHKSYRIVTPLGSYVDYYYSWIIDPEGEIVDSISFDMRTTVLPSRIIGISDGNFLMCGYENDSSLSGQTGVMFKLSPQGHPIWKREYRVSPPESLIHDLFYNAVEMPDKGFVLCGRAYGPLADSTVQNAWVIRVDSLGCLEPGCQLISAVEDPPAPEQDIGIALSPNPTSGQATLRLTHEGAVLLGVRVLDVQGRVVSDMQFLRAAGWREWVVDLGREPAGVYLVQVRTSEGWASKKIIKQ